MFTREWSAAAQIACQVRDKSMLVTEDGLWDAFEDVLDEPDMPHERFLYLMGLLGFFQNVPNN